MPKNTKSRKNTKSTEGAQLNMSVAAELEMEAGSSDASLIDSMLADMGGDSGSAGSEDIIEDPAGDEGSAIESTIEAAVAPTTTAALDDPDAIEAAVAELERAEKTQALYEGEEHPAEAASDADTPATPAEGAPAADKKPKEPKSPRVTYINGKASDVLKAKLGDKLSDALLLEVSDATLDPEMLRAKQEDLLALLNARPHNSEGGGSTQKKVAEKIVQLFGWMNKGGTLNEVMARTFKVLARDGEIVSGDKGNLHAELLSKPYSVGTARAQAGQMMAMLPMLKIANKADKGKLVANEDSLILMKVKAELDLA